MTLVPEQGNDVERMNPANPHLRLVPIGLHENAKGGHVQNRQLREPFLHG